MCTIGSLSNETRQPMPVIKEVTVSLSLEQMKQILEDTMQGRASSIKTSEADAFQKELKIDIDLAKRKGWVIDIPNEWEV